MEKSLLSLFQKEKAKKHSNSPLEKLREFNKEKAIREGRERLLNRIRILRLWREHR